MLSLEILVLSSFFFFYLIIVKLPFEEHLLHLML